VIALYKPTFLKDLVRLPASYRKKIEKLVFTDIPGSDNIFAILDISKIQGHQSYYRIRVGNYRIGCEIEAGNRVIFYRVKDRKDIYKVFP
jgi:mRNA interferase RelE/StbE